jgi:hypothetical protein
MRTGKAGMYVFVKVYFLIASNCGCSYGNCINLTIRGTSQPQGLKENLQYKGSICSEIVL